MCCWGLCLNSRWTQQPPVVAELQLNGPVWVRNLSIANHILIIYENTPVPPFIWPLSPHSSSAPHTMQTMPPQTESTFSVVARTVPPDLSAKHTSRKVTRPWRSGVICASIKKQRHTTSGARNLFAGNVGLAREQLMFSGKHLVVSSCN